MSTTEENFPLHQAASAGKLDVVQDLLAKGGDKDEKNSKGLTPLITAIISNHLNVVECLLEQGAEMDMADNSGHTPFFYAVVFNHTANTLELQVRLTAY